MSDDEDIISGINKLGMKDYAFAVRMMRAIRNRIRKEIDIMRPNYAYVIVDSINDSGNTLSVHYPDDPTNSFNVQSGSSLPVATGQVVRIKGMTGDKYVDDVLGGPSSNGVPGDVKYTASPNSQPGWLVADGSAYDPILYPNLWLAIGTLYGGTATAPLLPNFMNVFLTGKTTPGSTGGATSHTHVTPNHTHNLGSGGTIPSNGSAYLNATPSGGGGGNTSSGSNIPPYVGLVPLIKF